VNTKEEARVLAPEIQRVFEKHWEAHQKSLRRPRNGYAIPNLKQCERLAHMLLICSFIKKGIPSRRPPILEMFTYAEQKLRSIAGPTSLPGLATDPQRGELIALADQISAVRAESQRLGAFDHLDGSNITRQAVKCIQYALGRANGGKYPKSTKDGDPLCSLASDLMTLAGMTSVRPSTVRMALDGTRRKKSLHKVSRRQRGLTHRY